jgi:hypothetical protein
MMGVFLFQLVPMAVVVSFIVVRSIVTLFASLGPGIEGEPDSDGGPTDPGSDGGGGRRPEPPAPRTPPRGGLPLPDARPARVRLRDHERLGDRLPRRRRRPAREPDRRPVRARPRR